MFVYKFRQWSKFLRELIFLRELFLRIVKKPRKSPKFESGKISATRYVSTCDVSGLFWQFATWLVTQDLHKSNNGMIFSNKARLLLDFSRVVQNASPCEIMWKIKQSLFIYLSGYGSCHVRQAWCHARRRRTWISRSAILFWLKHYRINFCDKLRFPPDPKYLSMEK